jgi:hypothetical protein
MVLLWFVFGGLLLDARADKLPDWVLKRPPNTKQYKFYLGRSNPISSEKQALREAIEDAQEQALKENFGVILKVDAEAHATLSEVKLSKRTSEVSELARLVLFEPVETLITPVPGGQMAYVLCKYPVEEIEREKRRLRSVLQVKNGEGQIHEAGKAGGKNFGSLEITSDPPGVEVKVDHRPWGSTPIRIRGALEAGEHMIDLTHPEYEPELNGSVIVVPGQMTSYRKTLNRRKITLQIVSEPRGALVSVNGHTLPEQTPLEYTAFLGDPLSITLTHPETLSQTHQVKAIDGLLIPPINLVYKPARILLDTYPSGAEVYIDGKFMGKTGSGEAFVVTHGERSVELRKEGYSSVELEVEVKGGETKVVPTRTLTTVKFEELLRQREAEERRRYEEALKEREQEYRRQQEQAAEYRILSRYPGGTSFFTFGYGGKTTQPDVQDDEGFCCLQMGLGLHKRFYRAHYLRAHYNFALGMDRSQGEYSWEHGEWEYLVGHELGVGTASYLTESFRLGMEVGVMTSSRLAAQGEFDQTFYGITAAIEHITRYTPGSSIFASELKVRSCGPSRGSASQVQVVFQFVIGSVWD